MTENKVAAFSKDIEKKTDEIKDIFEKFEECEQKFVYQAEYNVLDEKFKIFSEIETIDKLQNVFLPKIYDFANKIDQMTKSNEEMTHCIRKFDEDISIKCNRLDLTLLRNHVDDNFLNNDSWEIIDQKVQELRDQTNEQIK